MMCEKKNKIFFLPKLNTDLQPFVIAPAASAKRTVRLKFTSTNLSIVPEFVVRQRI